jgi:hypothetical protein
MRKGAMKCFKRLLSFPLDFPRAMKLIFLEETQCTIEVMSIQTNPEKKTCPRCGKTFECFSKSGSCWCANFPPLSKTNADLDCFCPDCLKKEFQKPPSLKSDPLV